MSGVQVSPSAASNVIVMPAKRRDDTQADGGAPTTVVYVVTDDDGLVDVASVIAALERRSPVRQLVVHAGCGQIDLGSKLRLTATHRVLDVDGATSAERTAATMTAFDAILVAEKPDLVVIAGDDDPALAAAIAAAKRQIAISHLRSGLRSWDWTAPEEVNRCVIDGLADTLFTHSPEADANLLREGTPGGRIHRMGNTRVDVLRQYETTARRRAAWTSHGVGEREYILVALTRPATIDPPQRLRAIAAALAQLAADDAILLLTHPATHVDLAEPVTAGVLDRAGVRRVDAVDYVERLSLEVGAGAIITDATALQEDASVLGIPCYTPLALTASTSTLTHGTNVLLGDDPGAIADARTSRHAPTPAAIPLWDGRAGQRVADTLAAHYTLARAAR